METFTLTRDGGKDVRFSGEMLGEASSHAGRGEEQNRWAEIRLYRTGGGKYVCEQVGRTQTPGEHDRHTVVVCDTVEEVINFFGFGWLAKELYQRAGIDAVEVVD